MKDIKQYITEGIGEIEFNGQTFQFDQIIRATSHNDLIQATRLKELDEDFWKTMKQQKVKYVLLFPPHYTSAGDKVDEFIIKMFLKSKRLSDGYKGSEFYGLYDVKTHECVNKDKIKAYKIIRF